MYHRTNIVCYFGHSKPFQSRTGLITMPYLMGRPPVVSLHLMLYMEYVLGKTDFYKDVYEYIRVNKDLPTDGERQIEFAYNYRNG